MSTPASVTLSQSISTFVLHLHASPAEAIPLFGPVRETEWAIGWAPTFVYPEGGAQREGTVFRTYDKDRGHAVWVLTDLDEAAGRVGYVLVSPAYVLIEIKIRLTAIGAAATQATVMYRRTALSPAANGYVSGFTADWEAEQQAYWESAINTALANAAAPEQRQAQ